ncbi:MAG TPA: chemotaxis-specific protein-glutamate methyltransferase CheB [Allosphingosinicella sp.]|uniref:chemotaxis-specific protein-glutamate methyltransferase CheB n=1 Tax=Allosphingosinicella sp. TaxID=2823234 RepID=UPI002EDBA359
MTRAQAAIPGRSADRADQASVSRAPIRLMIVDDSQIARSVLSRMISAHKDFEIVATAGNAGEALAALKSVRVDVVLLDVEMPGTSGLDALPDILRAGNGARVLIVSSLAEEGAETTVRALALGAADTLPKPGANSFAGRFSDILVQRLRAIGRAGSDEEDQGVQTAPAPAPAAAKPAAVKLRAMPDHKLGCLALGASTGGLHALSEFLRALPNQIGAPILITQHLPPVFMPFFARQIEAASGRLTHIAEDRMPLHPERILIAPGEGHIELERAGSDVFVRISRETVSSGCRPSADPMLWSMGEVYGKAGLGVVFSGMGRDGLVGSTRLVNNGGAVIVQNEETSAVWGMPRAIAEAGLASAVLSPADLAGRVAARAERGRV